jgi:hypothetical protein
LIRRYHGRCVGSDLGVGVKQPPGVPADPRGCFASYGYSRTGHASVRTLRVSTSDGPISPHNRQRLPSSSVRYSPLSDNGRPPRLDRGREQLPVCDYPERRAGVTTVSRVRLVLKGPDRRGVPLQLLVAPCRGQDRCEDRCPRRTVLLARESAPPQPTPGDCLLRPGIR